MKNRVWLWGPSKGFCRGEAGGWAAGRPGRETIGAWNVSQRQEQ